MAIYRWQPACILVVLVQIACNITFWLLDAAQGKQDRIASRKADYTIDTFATHGDVVRFPGRHSVLHPACSQRFRPDRIILLRGNFVHTP